MLFWLFDKTNANEIKLIQPSKADLWNSYHRNPKNNQDNLNISIFTKYHFVNFLMNKTCLDPYTKGPRAAEPEDISEEESSADSTNGTHSGAGNRILNLGSGARGYL